MFIEVNIVEENTKHQHTNNLENVLTDIRDWDPLIAQLVKNPPAMQETPVWFLGWEDPLKKGKATHSSILAWRIPWTVQSMGSREWGTTKQLSVIDVEI